MVSTSTDKICLEMPRQVRPSVPALKLKVRIIVNASIGDEFTLNIGISTKT